MVFVLRGSFRSWLSVTRLSWLSASHMPATPAPGCGEPGQNGGKSPFIWVQVGGEPGEEGEVWAEQKSLALGEKQVFGGKETITFLEKGAEG